MLPIIMRWGGLSLPSYPILYGLGLLISGMLCIYIGKKDKISELHMAHLIFIMSISTLLGGHVLYCYIYSRGLFRFDISAIELSQGGLVHYGGLLMAVLIGVLSIKILRLPLGNIADIFAVSAPVAIAIGRIGCFMGGCCFGRRTVLPWGISYPPYFNEDGHVVGSPAFIDHINNEGLPPMAASSFPVHPSQLYESVSALIIFGIMLSLYRRNKYKNKLLIIYVIIYCSFRFFSEYTRTDDFVYCGLTIYQIASAALIFMASGIWYISGAAAQPIVDTRDSRPGQPVNKK